jgi:hypothetical protein
MSEFGKVEVTSTPAESSFISFFLPFTASPSPRIWLISYTRALLVRHLFMTPPPLVLLFTHLQRIDGFAGGARQGLLLDRHRQKVRDRQEDRHN